MEKRTTGGSALKPLRNTIRNNKGFTLIELIIVIIIIGILAAVAIPKYTEIQQQAADATAKGILSALRGSNQIVFANYNLQNKPGPYTMTEVASNAQIQGIDPPGVAADPDYTITISNRTYKFTMTTAPILPANPGIITCTAPLPACANW